MMRSLKETGFSKPIFDNTREPKSGFFISGRLRPQVKLHQSIKVRRAPDVEFKIPFERLRRRNAILDEPIEKTIAELSRIGPVSAMWCRRIFDVSDLAGKWP